MEELVADCLRVLRMKTWNASINSKTAFHPLTAQHWEFYWPTRSPPREVILKNLFAARLLRVGQLCCAAKSICFQESLNAFFNSNETGGRLGEETLRVFA